MLDMRRIREDLDQVKEAVESRGQGDFNIGKALELDEKLRALLAVVEQKKKQTESGFQGNTQTEEGRRRCHGADE